MQTTTRTRKGGERSAPLALSPPSWAGKELEPPEIAIDQAGGRVLVTDRGETFGYELCERRGSGKAGGLGWTELVQGEHGAVWVTAVSAAEVIAVCRDAGREQEIAQMTLRAAERADAEPHKGRGVPVPGRLRAEVAAGLGKERLSLRAIQALMVELLVEGETLVRLAERGGFVDRDGRIDTTWMERRAGLMPTRCSRTGKVRTARTASYKVFVRLVRAVGASPHEFDV